MGRHDTLDTAVIPDDNSNDVLSIGILAGGRTPGNRGWDEPLRLLVGNIIALRVGVVSDISVNVEFHIPGSILVPDFEGVRTGYFRKRDRLLKVQVALAPDAPPDPRGVLIAMIRLAFDAVDAWSIRRRIPAHTAALRALMDKVEQDGDCLPPDFPEKANPW
jgi:hypothetical protein